MTRLWLFGLAALVACSSGTVEDSTLEQVVVGEAPAGFVEDDAASGPVDRDAAASAGAQRSGSASRLLDGSAFRGATVRVWKQGREFQRVFAVRFSKESQATAYLAAELAALRASLAATVFPVTDPAGATGVLLSGETRGDKRGVFCQEVLLRSQDIVFEIATCSPDHPGSVDAATGLAKVQATRATLARGS